MNLILQAEDDMGDLWLGNFKAAKNIQALKANKIGTVISVANNIDLTYNPNDQIKHHVVEYNHIDSASMLLILLIMAYIASFRRPMNSSLTD